MSKELKKAFVSPKQCKPEVFEHKSKDTESGKITNFNKRGRWCYTNNTTNMGTGNSQKVSGSRR